jgi:hypothetical protein
MNYAEGQIMDRPSVNTRAVHAWEDYSEFSGAGKVYHVYAIDCHGHGNPVMILQSIGYAMGQDFVGLLKMSWVNRV